MDPSSCPRPARGWLSGIALCALFGFLWQTGDLPPLAGAPRQRPSPPSPARPGALPGQPPPPSAPQTGHRRFRSVRKWYGRYTVALRADETRSDRRTHPDGGTEGFTGRHRVEFRTTIDVELGEKETLEGALSWAGRTSGEGACQIDFTSEERSRTDAERVTTKRMAVSGAGRFTKPANVNRPVAEDDPDAPNGTGSLRMDLEDGTYDFELLSPPRAMRIATTVSETHTVDGKQEDAQNPPPFDGELPYGFSVNPRKYIFLVLPVPMVPTAVTQGTPTTPEAAMALIEQMQRFRFRLPASGLVLAGEERTDYLLELPRAPWQEKPAPARVQLVATWRFTPDASDAPPPTSQPVLAGGAQTSPTPGPGEVSGPTAPPLATELPTGLTIAGFQVKEVRYTAADASAAAGEGKLVLPFPGLAPELAEIPVTFAGWAIRRLGAQVTAGTLSVDPPNWRWAAEPGLSFSLSRIRLDAAVPDVCTVDGALALSGVFSLPALQGVTLTRAGVLRALPAFDAAGLHFESADAELDFSYTEPRLRGPWMGVAFPAVEAVPLQHPSVRLVSDPDAVAGGGIGFGILNGAVHIVGALRLKTGNQVSLPDMGGTGVDVLIRDPSVRYSAAAGAGAPGGWVATGQVTVTLPPILASRQITVADGGVGVTPEGRLEYVAEGVAVQPALAGDLGAFLVKDVGQLSFDLSDTRTGSAGNPGSPTDAAWKGIVLQSGKVELPPPVAQEGDPVNLEFTFIRLGVGLENGEVSLAGRLRLTWPGRGGERTLRVADWPGLDVTITGVTDSTAEGGGGREDATAADAVTLSLDDLSITGGLDGRVTLPQALVAAGSPRPALSFQEAVWDPAGLYVELFVGGDVSSSLATPAGAVLTLKPPGVGVPSAILDLSPTRSPRVGPELVKQNRWKGIYLSNAEVRLEVHNLGAVTFGATDAYVDPRGITGAFAADVTGEQATTPQSGVKFPITLERAEVEFRRGALVQGSAVVGALHLFDQEIAFEFAVGRAGTWEGGLDLQRGVSLDLGMIQFDFTEGGLVNGDLRVSGTVTPRFGGRTSPISFRDLTLQWGPFAIDWPDGPLRLNRPVSLDLYGFSARVNSLAIEALPTGRAGVSKWRVVLDGGITLPEMEGVSASGSFSGLCIEMACNTNTKTLGAPTLSWEGDGARVSLAVEKMFSASGNLAFRDDDEGKRFSGNLRVVWMDEDLGDTQTASFNLGHDTDGDFWSFRLTADTDIPLGMGLKLTRLKAAAAWGMRCSSGFEPPGVGDGEPGGPPSFVRDADASFFGSGYVRLGDPAAREALPAGWFGFALALPGPSFALAGSPRVLGILDMGDTFMSWDAEKDEFRATGDMDGFNKLLKFLPGAQAGGFDLLVGKDKFHLASGWPDGDKPGIHDMNIFPVIILGVPCEMGFGFNVGMEEEGADTQIDLGLAVAVGIDVSADWEIFYVRAGVAAGGMIEAHIAPSKSPPIYGEGKVWVEAYVAGGVDLGDLGRWEAIECEATVWVALRSPGPKGELVDPDAPNPGAAMGRDWRARWDDSFHLKGVLDLSYHYDAYVVSGSGHTNMSLSVAFP